MNAVDLDAEVHKLTGELLVALRGWRESKRMFAEVTRAYVDAPRYADDQITAVEKARQDPRRKDAVGYTAFYQQEAQTAALAILALRGGP